MGEKIKDLGYVKLLDQNFVVELNKATVPNGSRYIHLQNSNFRLQMEEQEVVLNQFQMRMLLDKGI